MSKHSSLAENSLHLLVLSLDAHLKDFAEVFFFIIIYLGFKKRKLTHLPLKLPSSCMWNDKCGQ